jgi:hypothetical protein
MFISFVCASSYRQLLSVSSCLSALVYQFRCYEPSRLPVRLDQLSIDELSIDEFCSAPNARSRFAASTWIVQGVDLFGAQRCWGTDCQPSGELSALVVPAKLEQRISRGYTPLT